MSGNFVSFAIVGVALLVCVSVSSEETCKDNEILAACGRTCEGTCEHPFRPEICKRIRCANQGCQCDLSRGYVRDPVTDKCVRNQDDESCAAQIKCPANSEPRICGGVCQATCSKPLEIFCKLDPTNCVINCHCLRGFVKNERTGECVRRNQCPPGSNGEPASTSAELSQSDESDE